MNKYQHIHVSERVNKGDRIVETQLPNGTYCEWIASMCRKGRDILDPGTYDLFVNNMNNGDILFCFRGDDCNVVTFVFHNNKLFVCAGFCWDDDQYDLSDEEFETRAKATAERLGLKYVKYFNN